MHDGMQYDPICPDSRLRSRALQSWKFDHFQKLSPLQFTMDSYTSAQYLNLMRPDFLYLA